MLELLDFEVSLANGKFEVLALEVRVRVFVVHLEEVVADLPFLEQLHLVAFLVDSLVFLHHEFLKHLLDLLENVVH
jgi:hypothetical protein